MNKKSLKELKCLIEKEIEYENSFLKSFENSENPQVQEMYIKTKSKIETLQDILEYTRNGSKLYFNSN